MDIVLFFDAIVHQAICKFFKILRLKKSFFFQFKHWLFLPGFGEFFELLMESLLVQSQMRTPEPDIWKRKLHYYEITNMTIKHSKKISKKPLKRTLD